MDNLGLKVGVPRGLLYYEYYPLWAAFLEALGFEVTVSPDTNKRIVDLGVTASVDEACLPVKIYLGHARYLAERVDTLFAPRMVSVEPRTYICPKLMGLPDMLKARVEGDYSVLDPCVDLSRGRARLDEALIRFGDEYGASEKAVREALRAGLSSHESHKRLTMRHNGILGLCRDWSKDDITVGILGHTYNVLDEFVGMGLIRHLVDLGARPITAEAYGDHITARYANAGRKRLFWTLERRILGAGMKWLTTRDVDGIVVLVSFGCGPGSFISDLICREAARLGTIPVMVLSLDEHSGDAGTMTRIEAFIDTIKWRKTGLDSDISASWRSSHTVPSLPGSAGHDYSCSASYDQEDHGSGDPLLA